MCGNSSSSNNEVMMNMIGDIVVECGDVIVCMCFG